MFKRVCVIGVGLIGGSIAKAARANGLVETLVGFGRLDDVENLQLAKDLNVIDEFYTDIETAVTEADCVIIATPVAATENILRLLKPFWSKDTVYFDVGSTKGNVVAAAETVFGFVPDNFIPAHPIAGAENSGVQAALVDLFVNKRLILTPLENTDAVALQKTQQFWEKIGAVVSIMDVQQHDSVLAATSHLPHLLAFALVDMLGRRDEQEEIFKYAAGGFRDFTRIASSDPIMWQAICAANKLELLPLLEQFKTELTKIQNLLETGNYLKLFELFSYANTARERFLNQTKN
ncbi:MAG: prephenate dehydrogenase/arogenate dehydrogenase family protein [Methylococcales bacterium]|nr:prephenate dehydrogenase/arogenate dehydrogenase family protein [Methylococcales bacterium]